MKLKLDFAEKGKVNMNLDLHTVYGWFYSTRESDFPLNSVNFQAPIHLLKYFGKQP